MITLAPREAEILQTYKITGTVKTTAELCETSTDTVRRYMIALTHYGLAKRLDHGRYEILDIPYTVMTFSEKMEEKRNTKHEIKVAMSESEKQFMNEHYKTKYQKNRGEAARILGRTRGDICLMAQALNLQLKEGEYGGKADSSRSA